MTMISSSRIIVLAIASLLVAPSVALAQSAQAPGRAAPAAPATGASKAAPGGAAVGVAGLRVAIEPE